MNHLTRRDFLRLCTISSTSLFLAACGVAPTPTATPAPTNTPLLTNTALPNLTPTLANTPAPTSTATPLKPTITPENRSAIARWFVDFENGWGDLNSQRSIAEQKNYGIVDYPDRGRVYIGELNLNSRVFTSDGHHRLYPSIWVPFVGGEIFNALDILIESDYRSESGGELVSLISIFDVGAKSASYYHVSFTVDLVRFGSLYYPLPHFPGYDGKPRIRGTLIPFTTPFSFDKWNRIVAILGKDGSVRVYQNGEQISFGIIFSESKVGVAGAHWGLYSGDTLYKMKLYNDNIDLRVFA